MRLDLVWKCPLSGRTNVNNSRGRSPRYNERVSASFANLMDIASGSIIEGAALAARGLGTVVALNSQHAA